ncbi:YlxR family protein [Frankia sp. CiP3]|uniref:YlxR family protein n=1 Tax=Frankia sp. CiP3 TaxID=2880971 RepID=UPI00210852DC|nr:YlxR family protein [Frankia sp. CiP3]
MAARRAEPLRTCVGCRTRAVRSDLVRMVVVGGELVPDVHRRMPGRGAHLHPDLACLDLAERRRAFPRALRVPGPLGLGGVRGHLVKQFTEDWTTSPDVDMEAGRDSDDRAMSTQP